MNKYILFRLRLIRIRWDGLFVRLSCTAGQRVRPAILSVGFFLGSITILTSAQSQTKKASALDGMKSPITLLARIDKDSVVLRWAPASAGAWTENNRNGYIIERVALSADGSFDRKSYQRLMNKPLVPWTKSAWDAQQKKIPDKNKSLWQQAAMIALYGEEGNAIRKPKDFNEIVNASNQFSNRFAFALMAADNDPVAAEGLALRFVDHGVKTGGKYIYRVFPATGTIDDQRDTGYTIVEMTAYTPVPPPSGIEVEIGDGRLRLHWPENPLTSYSGYYIDRSDDGGKTFKRMNNVPHITLQSNQSHSAGESQFRDTTTVNYHMYTYHVHGITPFGELSDAAEIKAFSKDLTPPPAPEKIKATPAGSHAVRINWDLKKQTGDFAGFVILRSFDPTKGFEQLAKLGKTDRQFTDDSVGKEILYYYSVSSIDTSGNTAPSLSVSALIADSLPPQPPLGLSGTIDTNGIVRLHWHMSPEQNILGYRLLWANDPKEEFAQRTPTVWTDTSYIDTIVVKTLTRYIYYRVAAVNKRRLHSDVSTIVSLKRPSVVSPPQSVFTNVLVTDTSVNLSWAHSPSEDLAYQLLLRRASEKDQAWTILDTAGKKAEFYMDRKVEQNVMYQYQLIAVDSSGLRSQPSSPVQGRPYDRGLRPAVQNLSAQYDSVAKSVTLKWSYTPSRQEEYWFVVYRSVEGRPLGMYRSVKSETAEFRDSDLPLPPYKYAVRVVTKSGAQSVLSDTAIVRK